MSFATRHIAVAAAVAALVLPTTADAQLGGLKDKLKKKVEQATTAEPAPTPATPATSTGETSPADGRARKGQPAAAPAAPSHGVYNEYTLEITDDVMTRLSTALTTELAQRAEARKKILPPDKYAACTQTQSPEDKVVMDSMLAAADKQDIPNYQRLATKMGEVKATRCGPDPRGSEASTLLAQAPREAALAAGKFTKDQYAILRERVRPFCKLTTTSSGATQIPGSGSNVYWVYSETETRVLRPKCGELTAALTTLN